MKIRESDNPDRKPIDFSVEDENDNVAWVWGNTPDDIEIECDHAEVTYGDDDEEGECVICGARCEWHYEDDSGSVEDYHWEGKEKVPHHWTKANIPSGLIGKYIKEQYGKTKNLH